MLKSTGRHAKPKTRWVGPLYAYGAIRLHWEGKRELEAAVASQLRDGMS